MEKLNIERIREYNTKCNEYKTKLSNTIAERKIMSDNLTNLCSQLSAQLGINVTPDNLEQVYTERSQAIKQTLESGEEILRRIEGAENVGTPSDGVEQPQMVMPQSTGFENAQPVRVTEQPVQPAQTGNFGGLPESNYKMPSGFGGNAFMQANVFHGKFSDIKPSDDGVDEI